MNKKNKLKILKIIHGYPPYYMAGSEVYTYNLCKELSKFHEVDIFTRIENNFSPFYTTEETIEHGIKIFRVNKPGRDYTFRSKYIDEKLIMIFEEFLKNLKPDIVHIGHLSHLTVLIVNIIKKKKIPIVFTLHDYWMMCIRGQLIHEDLSLCLGPEIDRCAQCNKKYFLDIEEAKKEIKLWLGLIKHINKSIDLFIAPSEFLRQKYIEFGIPEEKIVYMDYGFDKTLLKTIKKCQNQKIRFGYIGRIIQVKGITTLVEAFNEIDHSRALLNIYGNSNNSKLYLKNLCKNSAIHFKGGFNYDEISKVLSEIDVLIVPSIWYENSPLVIHEAIEANIPIITTNLGGMSELVKHEHNGLLFERRNSRDLINKINRFIQEPELIKTLTLKVTPVKSIQEDAKDITKLYLELLE